jgi:hypothetical protein
MTQWRQLLISFEYRQSSPSLYIPSPPLPSPLFSPFAVAVPLSPVILSPACPFPSSCYGGLRITRGNMFRTKFFLQTTNVSFSVRNCVIFIEAISYSDAPNAPTCRARTRRAPRRGHEVLTLCRSPRQHVIGGDRRRRADRWSAAASDLRGRAD